MPRSWWLLGTAVLLAGNGCTQSPVEPAVREMTREDESHDTEKAAETTDPAPEQAKEDFETRLKTGLAEIEVEIAKLQEKGIALKDKARIQWNEKMDDLRAKKKLAHEKLDELGKSTGEAWSRLEKGAQSAWDDVRKAFEEAAKEF